MTDMGFVPGSPPPTPPCVYSCAGVMRVGGCHGNGRDTGRHRNGPLGQGHNAQNTGPE